MQVKHFSALLSAAYVPEAQLVQLVEPVMAWLVPALHLEHMLAPVAGW